VPALVPIPIAAIADCLVTRLHMAMMALQSASCSGLALDARYASTLAPVGDVVIVAPAALRRLQESFTTSQQKRVSGSPSTLRFPGAIRR
jgi:hypothetical protein